MRAVAWLLVAGLVVTLPLGAGCILKDKPDPDRVVEGRPDGETATNRYYKIYLVSEEGRTFLAAFDREHWHVAGLEREARSARLDYAAVKGLDRELINEVAAREFLQPGDWNRFRYDVMEARAEANGEPFDREALDAEWDARLAELHGDAGLEAPGAEDAPVVLTATEPSSALDAVQQNS